MVRALEKFGSHRPKRWTAKSEVREKIYKKGQTRVQRPPLGPKNSGRCCKGAVV